MSKFTIYASKTQDLKVTIDAENIEEARKIAESDDLITDDYECENQEFKISLICPEEDIKCDSCKEAALDDNACADHKGECYECCGCGELEDKAVKIPSEARDITAFNLADIEAVIASNISYDAFITAQDTHPDNATLDLIGTAYELDADDMHDEELLSLIQEILSMRLNWIARYQ
jgi:hypothetical protein